MHPTLEDAHTYFRLSLDRILSATFLASNHKLQAIPRENAQRAVVTRPANFGGWQEVARRRGSNPQSY